MQQYAYEQIQEIEKKKRRIILSITSLLCQCEREPQYKGACKKKANNCVKNFKLLKST